MTKKKVLFLALGALATVAAISYLTIRLAAPRHRINAESIKLIQKNMTEAEVIAILGGPPGSYARNDLVLPTNMPLEGDEPGPGRFYKTWWSDQMSIVVCFDSSGKVAGKWAMPVFRLWDESWLEKIRRWLGV